MKTERLVALLLIIGIAMFLAGCAGVRVQWALSYQSDNVAADIEQARSDALARAKSVQREEAVRLSIAK